MHCMRVACSRPRDGCSFPDSDVYHIRRSADALEGVLEPARRGPPPAPATYILDAMSQVDKVR